MRGARRVVWLMVLVGMVLIPVPGVAAARPGYGPPVPTPEDQEEAVLPDASDLAGSRAGWSAPTQLASDCDAWAMAGAIGVYRRSVHVAYICARGEWPEIRSGVFYTSSQDGGRTWQRTRRLSNWMTYPEEGIGSLDLAVSGEAVHVIWGEEDGDPWGGFDFRLVYRRSEDGGATWSRRLKLAEGVESAAIAADGTGVHVVFNDSNLYYRGSHDEGTTWSPKKRIAHVGSSGHRPAVAASGTTVHVAFVSDVPAGIPRPRYRRSDDAGASWSRISNLGSAQYGLGSLAMDSYESAVHVVYRPYTALPGPLVHRSSRDGGLTWDPRQVITRQPRLAAASIDASAERVAVFTTNGWDEGSPPGTADYVFSTDGGSTWSPSVAVEARWDCAGPSVAVWQKTTHFLWCYCSGTLWYRRAG